MSARAVILTHFSARSSSRQSWLPGSAQDPMPVPEKQQIRAKDSVAKSNRGSVLEGEPMNVGAEANMNCGHEKPDISPSLARRKLIFDALQVLTLFVTKPRARIGEVE